MSEYLSLLRRNANYRNLWLGSVISFLGDWFNLIAAAELVSSLTSSSGLAVSTLFLLRFLPLFLFSPIAGVLADRFDRRKIMIFTDLSRAATVAAFLLIRSPEQLWLFYVLTFLQFTLSALFTPAKTAVLANIVAREDLVTANALDSFTWSTMLALGSFAGGAVAFFFGVDASFLADALTFLLSAIFISRIVMPQRERELGHSGGWLDFLDGLRYLRSEKFLLAISLVKAGGSLAWGAINVLEVTFANDVFENPFKRLGQMVNPQDASAATLGVIYFVTGLGTGLGPIFMRRWLGDQPRRLMLGISIGFVLLASGIFGLGVAPTFGIFLAMSFVRTVGSGTIWVFSAALLQMMVPDRYRGRVFAFEFALLTLTQSISIFAAGYLLDTAGFSPQQVAIVSAATAAGVAVLWGIFYFRYNSQRKAPESRPADSGQ
ncbi:MAG: MFS transporter [Candidatus Promineifilaceae bacterium]